MADVDLVLRGLLVHGVVKVDAVNVLQPPVLPEEEGPEAQEGKQHCGDRWPGITPRPTSCPKCGVLLPSDFQPFYLLMVLF